MSRLNLPTWRSLLYVPAHKTEMVAGAHKRGADAIILDLEDGVPEDAKDAARASLQGAVSSIAAEGADVLVRVNKPWNLAWLDIQAAVEAGASALLLPKVADACQPAVISSYLDDLGPDAGMVGLVVLIESAAGLWNLEGLTLSSPRLLALVPGNEDLATDLGILPEPERMLQVYLPVLVAARARGLRVYGTLGGSADFRDLAGYRRRVALSKEWGFSGATCIHPSQVQVIHEVYEPGEAELRTAKHIVEAFEAGGGDPVALEGRMVDRPIYLRARRLLRQLGES